MSYNDDNMTYSLDIFTEKWLILARFQVWHIGCKYIGVSDKGVAAETRCLTN